MNKQTQNSRGGVVYVAVLGVTLVVGIMASVAMTIVRLDMRVSRTSADQRDARRLASAAVEYAVNRLQHDASWRSTFPNATEFAATNWGGGVNSVIAFDSDGDLADDLRDSVVISGIGKVGEAVAVESVTLQPTGSPLSCLEVAVMSHDSVELEDGTGVLAVETGPTVLRSNQLVASNGDVYAFNYRQVDASVEAGGMVGGDVTGTTASEAPPRVLPNEHMLDYYKTVGTAIPIASFPVVNEARRMQAVVLSPASNPYGASNVEGIYVVDCQGQDLRIQHVRVVGTLVLLNAGPGSGILSVSLFEPVVANFPVLLVDGDFSLDTSVLGDHSLGELTAGISLNPAGTPYQGSADSDLLDSFPSGLYGLTHVSGTTYAADDTRIFGGLVTNRLVVGSAVELEVNYRDVYYLNPPPGFATGDPMRIIPGSWRRSTY